MKTFYIAEIDGNIIHHLNEFRCSFDTLVDIITKQLNSFLVDQSTLVCVYGGLESKQQYILHTSV